jgi:hypothetical protein
MPIYIDFQIRLQSDPHNGSELVNFQVISKNEVLFDATFKEKRVKNLVWWGLRQAVRLAPALTDHLRF